MDAEENKADEIVSVGASEVVAVDSEVVAVDVKEVVDADGHSRKVVTTTKRVTTTKHADAADAASAPAPSVKKAAGPLAAYEAWVNSHASLARNVETMLYIAPQLVPVRSLTGEEGVCERMLTGAAAAADRNAWSRRKWPLRRATRSSACCTCTTTTSCTRRRPWRSR
jgi:hypothetical protein